MRASNIILNRRHMALFCAIMALAIGLRWLAFSPFAIVHLDEVLQYQERAFRMVFGRGIVPWETRHGLRGALIPQLLAGPMWLMARVTDDFWAPLLAARTVFAGLCLSAVPAAYAIGRLRSPGHGLVAMFVAAVWFESVLFGVQTLSESIGTATACCGAAAILQARDNRNAALLGGFLLTLTVLLRLQYVAFVATIVLLAAGRDLALWRRLILGSLPALALGAVSDLAAGTVPFAWAATNFGINLHQGRAATFGLSPPWAYLVGMMQRLSPAAPLILLAAFFSGRQYRPLLAAAIVNLAAHSLIGHKEYRFIWLSVFVIVILAAIASVDLLARLKKEGTASPDGPRSAGLATLYAGWAVLSLVAFQTSGRLATFRDEGPLAVLAVRATQIPGICAIGAPIPHRKALAYVFMPKPLAFYLYPDAMNRGTAPFTRDFTDAMDALILTGRGAPPPGYRRISCEMHEGRRACLYWRSGGCRENAGAASHLYQTIMIANDQ